MKLNEPALKPWAAVKTNGFIICAHCDCAAGYISTLISTPIHNINRPYCIDRHAEVCSHVSSMLYVAASINQAKSKQSCTDVLAYWTKPHSRPVFTFS